MIELPSVASVGDKTVSLSGSDTKTSQVSSRPKRKNLAKAEKLTGTPTLSVVLLV
jgi:hypothetical protein